ncbi:glutathione S-transferase family protein [Roseomonas stagni]|uniref:Glutathione S-transferase family protein n=1 Tax=Falsiroseomonas algicola TaxID=2716930 RepID=A0A6M1LND1_9PROT|nr:glutathione S-transferase family protein [Falsiroseomonas algicola]NGM21875.1 glutathione S-transferase family protein [Falsiroseomonas algicola]
MTYILHGDIGSGSAMPEMALAEIGAPVDLRDVPLEGDHQLRAEYRAINPMGRLPTLVLPAQGGDGTVLTESLAILVTLADRHPEAGLLPPPGETARAVALRWMALLAGEFYPQVTRWDYPARFGYAPDQVEAARDNALAMGRDVLRIIEAHALPVAGGPFLLGARFSVADIALAVMSRWMKGREWVPVNLPRIQALAEAVAARPAIAPVWARHCLGRPG